MHVRVFLSRYRSYGTCAECGGSRLKAEARLFRVASRTLPEVEALPIAESERLFREWSAPAQRSRPRSSFCTRSAGGCASSWTSASAT